MGTHTNVESLTAKQMITALINNLSATGSQSLPKSLTQELRRAK
jgi:hypothetical protein